MRRKGKVINKQDLPSKQCPFAYEDLAGAKSGVIAGVMWLLFRALLPPAHSLRIMGVQCLWFKRDLRVHD